MSVSDKSTSMIGNLTIILWRNLDTMIRIFQNKQILFLLFFLSFFSCSPSPDTQLLTAAKKGDASAVKAALAEGADVNAKDGQDETALILAAKNGDLPLVKILTEAKADLNAAGKSTLTALHVASQRGDFEMAKYLIAQGANINARSSLGWTPLSLAMLNNHTELAVLLRHGGGKATESIEKDDTQKFLLDRMVQRQKELDSKMATRPPEAPK